MKRKDVVFQTTLILDQTKIKLPQILPVDSIRFVPAIPNASIELQNSLNRKDFEAIDFERIEHKGATELKLSNQMAETILVKSNVKQEVEITVLLGSGYYAIEDESFTNLFERQTGWVGSDGIYSINITGPDNYYDEDPQTLFCFGDTFFGSVDHETNHRLSPHLMVNNSFALLQGRKPVEEKIEFFVKENEQGHYDSVIVPKTPLSLEGTIAEFLTSADYEDTHPGWVSSYQPEAIELNFDLNDTFDLKEVQIFNYFLPNEPFAYANRGLKVIRIQTSLDGRSWEDVRNGEWLTVEKAESLTDATTIPLSGPTRFIRFIGKPVVGEGNYGGAIPGEALFGLRKVRFVTKEGQVLLNVKASANTEFHRDQQKIWYWMQDGIKLNDAVYYFPLLVGPDDTQPEGFKFRVDGVAMIKIPIRDGVLDFENHEQFDTSLYYRKDGFDMPFGAAILNNTVENNPVNGDGYIYIYGYGSETNAPFRNLVVARVKPEHFERVDHWRFYNGKEWTPNIEESAPLVGHVSCEMSVSPILEGEDKGKYIAVFMYNVNSGYVAYSIADTPYGPFGPVHKVYYATEQDRDPRIYTYNAKAHPHLSESNGLLVSYNVNTFSDALNEADGTIYRPRFIRLVRIDEA